MAVDADAQLADANVRLAEANEALARANVAVSNAASGQSGQSGTGDSIMASRSKAEDMFISPYLGLRLGVGAMWRDVGTTPAYLDIPANHGGVALGASFGVRFRLIDEIAFRVEADRYTGYFKGDYEANWNDSQSQTTGGYMANIYLDLFHSREYEIKPYFGLGIGTMSYRERVWRIWGSPNAYTYSVDGSAYGTYVGFVGNLSDTYSTLGDFGLRYIRTRINDIHVSMTTVNFGIRFMF